MEQVTISQASKTVEPSLEEQARAAGIDIDGVDPTAQSQEAPKRPEWLPPKFKTEAELAAAYAELERKLGSQGQNPDENKDQGQEAPKVEEPAKEEPSAEDQAREATEKAGINYDELSKEYYDNGETLSDQAYEKLEKAGIPRNLVDQFIQGQKAVVEAQRQTVFATVGGQAQYDAMTQWAAENLSEAEVAAYNAAVDNGDMNSVMMAVKGLQSRYEASVGLEPARRVTGKAPQTVNRYNSIAEMQEDMANPKYENDPAFRAMVERKLAASDIF